MEKKNTGDPSARGSAFLAEEDLFGGFARVKGTSLFLGKYSLAEVGAVLGKKSFFKEARKRGLWPLTFEMDSSEFPAQRFQIFFQDKKPENLIVDLKIKETTFHLKNSLIYGVLPQDFRVLAFEWLTLQNPRLHFTHQKPALPGQAAPGLSLSKKVMDLFTYLGRLLQKAIQDADSVDPARMPADRRPAHDHRYRIRWLDFLRTRHVALSLLRAERRDHVAMHFL
jgi:hypothetical protein